MNLRQGILFSFFPNVPVTFIQEINLPFRIYRHFKSWGSKSPALRLRVLKTSLPCSSGQTNVFKNKIAKGIQKWIQNNQLSTVTSTYCVFKNHFSELKNHQKNRTFWGFLKLGHEKDVFSSLWTQCQRII